MKKKEFQNLPSTETPINAENLNEMQDNIEESCVIVSPTEPTTNEKVWIQKGKNLFDYESVNSYTDVTQKVIIDNEEAFQKIAGTVNQWVIVYLANLALKDGEDYTISFDIWADIETNFNLKTVYINTSTSTSHNLENITTEKQRLTATFTYMKDSSSDLLHLYPVYVENNNLYISNVQIEQGTEATEYEEYIEEKVLVKNDNGAFVPFVPKNKTINITTSVEFETGRIINSKVEYGKRISCGKLPDTTGVDISTGLVNVTVTNIEAIIFDNEKNTVMPLPYVASYLTGMIGIYTTNYGGAIHITTGENRSTWYCEVTVYYTKN